MCGSTAWKKERKKKRKNKNQAAEEAVYFPLLCVVLSFFILE